jgi:hypothetical protein
MGKLREWLDEVRVVFTTFLALLGMFGTTLGIVSWLVPEGLELAGWILAGAGGIMGVYLFYCFVLLVKRQWEAGRKLEEKEDAIAELEGELEDLKGGRK